MRAENVIDLIKAHYEKDDNKFDIVVKEIIDNEEKKGNVKLSEKIINLRGEYKNDLRDEEDYGSDKKNLYSYGPSSGLIMRENSKMITPKDKSSQSDLFELSYPNKHRFEKIVLSKDISNKVEEIVIEYKSREKLAKLNLDVENRLLLCGPPGCGKTTTAYLISTLLDLPLAYVRLDSLVTSLLGQTGTNIRKVFDAVRNQEVVLFIDEFDAIAKKRDDNHELGELKRVVNTLLQNIDLLPNNVFLVAATNHQSLLDKAVWRRFNTVLFLDLPDLDLRSKYITNTLSNYEELINLQVDIHKISRLCKGMSFAAIHEILHKAIKKCVLHGKKKSIETKDVTEALINTVFLYNKGNNIDIEKLKELKENGLSIRHISEMTSIPRSTLSDWIKKEGEKNEQ
ncbi:AAA family ATPase [Heyndrickxia sporothermodurans]